MKNIYSIFRVFLPAAILLILINGATTNGLGQTREAVVVSSISGQIKSGGIGLENVTVTLSGSATMTTTTSPNGFYSFFNLPDGGTYTVTPSLPDYFFTPPSQTFLNFSGAPNNINFTAVETCWTPRCRVRGKVLFARTGNIFTANRDGSGAVNITENTAGGSSPSFSPDGDKIIFISNRDGNQEIYTMNLSGGNVIRLTTNPAVETSPSFSSDGSKILFASDRDGNSEIYTMNADGTNPARLTNNLAPDISPGFSPDGSKIVFTRLITNQSYAMFTMNADGSNQIQITTPGSARDEQPSFSPDGRGIIFTRFDFGSFFSPVHRINTDGSNLVTYPTSFSRNASPSFSPNGKDLIYAVLPDGSTRYNIMTLSLTGGGIKFIAMDATNPDWQPLRPPRPQFDFDGNLSSDISVFRPSNGFWYLRQSNGGYGEVQFGATGDLIVPADYDGDRKTDLAVFRRGDDSTWYILQSSNNSLRAVQWGARNVEQPILFDTPVPADYDGDGKADIAVWRLTDNVSEPARFLILQSAGLTLRVEQWGSSSDRPVPADYDGDERADAAVYRNGTWYILQSSNNLMRAVQFGLGSDKTVPADYDFDGKTDIAVYRPSNGFWYLLNSGSNSFAATQFGIAEDKPSPADYDGDGKADLAVYRPGDGTWYLLRSTAGFTGIQFGTSADLPTPNAFVR